MIRSFKGLDIYRKSYQLAVEIHRETLRFPAKAGFDFLNQIQRASKSIPVNIAEGFGKRISQKDFARFITIAIGSKDEMLVHLDFAKDLDFLSEQKHKYFCKSYDELGQMMFGFRKKLNQNTEI